MIFDADDYIALLPCAWRTIQRYGVNLGGLTYDSPALDPYRGRSSGIPLPRAAGSRWEIRYDPYRLNRTTSVITTPAAGSKRRGR